MDRPTKQPTYSYHRNKAERGSVISEMYDRLAAYEDTGLTPEEITALTNEVDRMGEKYTNAVSDCNKAEKENAALKAKLARAVEDIKEMLHWSTYCVFCKEPRGPCGGTMRVRAPMARGRRRRNERFPI